MHAEKLGIDPLNDGDVTVFVRLGSDYNNNYYEYEIPVKLTQPGFYDPNTDADKYSVWPGDNEFIIDFEKITAAKIQRVVVPESACPHVFKASSAFLIRTDTFGNN